jgi:hypothetical protein
MKHPHHIILVLASIACVPSALAAPKVVDFNRPDGEYRPKDFARDFGSFSSDNCITEIRDGALRVTYPKGRKIEGLRGARVAVPARNNYVLEFRIKYDKDFEDGLHGKEFGLAGGAGYTGGHGREAREKGDGWSVRMQFDAYGGKVANQIYVYHSQMKGKYGESLGSEKQKIMLRKGRWHDIRLKVTMQSSPDKADGMIEVWEGGKRRIRMDNIRFARTQSGCQVDQLALEAFCGGAGIVPTRDNHVYYDDIRWWSEGVADKENSQ